MSKAQLYMKMINVMEEVGQLKKDGSVKDFSGKKMYDYLSEEQVTGELQQCFIKNKLVVFPFQVDEEFFYIEGTNSRGEYKNPTTKVNVKYKIVDAETGEFEIINSVGYGTDTADKGSNKAMTGAFKYAMRQSFAISTGDDVDHTSSDVITQGNTTSRQATPSARPTENGQQSPSAPVGQSGQRQSVQNGLNAKSRVINLKTEMQMDWDALGKLASDVLGRQIGKVISDIKSEDEWKKVEDAMLIRKAS